eukprot:TRINITY_DN46773_c0_g1_i1.p1 TRINITY_DN46773_c0_g1~~TRINITY_DN46773_c0_g1_i1.p1  ORF type:complete len:252 (-),score=37.17 TRINITY_DN46773_c0_g1_i1:64-819(-)
MRRTFMNSQRPFGAQVPQLLGSPAFMQGNLLYKTKLCSYWSQNPGQCAKGPRCIYAHGPEELRPKVPMPMPPVSSFQAGFPFLPPRPGCFGKGALQAMPAFGKGAFFNALGAFFGAPQPVNAPPKEEFVFTVDDEEKRKREERAKRFAPRPASFEKETEAKKEPNPSPEHDITREAEKNGADAVSGADGVDGACSMEESIADFLLDMQQQYMLGAMEGMDASNGDDASVKQDADGIPAASVNEASAATDAS